MSVVDPVGPGGVGSADYFSQLADQALASNDFSLAATHLEQALEFSPDNIDVMFRRAHCLQSGGELEAAINAYEVLIELRPDLSSVKNNLGNAYAIQGNLEAALACLQSVVEAEPTYPDGYANLGNILFRLGRFEESEQSVCDAIGLDAQNPSYWYNLGNVLQAMQRYTDAIRCYQRSIRLEPDFAGCHNNLGNIYRSLGQYSSALPVFEKAIQLDPENAETYANLGGLCSDAGELSLARKYYEKALIIDENCQSAFSNLLYLLNYVQQEPRLSLLDMSKKWGARFAAAPDNGSLAVRQFPRKAKIKVGYVSPDFRRHSVAFFIESLLDGHDRDRFDVYCYSNVTRGDDVTQRLQAKSDHWRPIFSLADEHVADVIREDGIDVLVDLAGHTAGNRLSLFASRLAPVQVSWLGYPNTTGVDNIDYRITDHIADPPEHGEIHSEALHRLDGPFLCYRGEEDSPDVSPPPVIENGYITFGCFNNITKITDVVVRTWALILRAVPDSHLLVKSKMFEDAELKSRFMTRFVDAGVAAERLELIGRTAGLRQHLDSYSRVDIALDTFPYNGTTTTCEALWMGVPVVGVYSKTHRSRVSLSIANRIGLGSLIVSDPDKLVALATSMGRSPQTLESLRTTLRQRLIDSDLCNTENFSRQIESAFSQMLLSASQN